MSAIHNRVVEMKADKTEASDAVPGTAVALVKLHDSELEANLKRCTSAASDSGGLTMCADQHCPEYGTCYRSQVKPVPDQRFWAVSPREENSCRFYAPIYFTNGASALRDGA